MTDENSGELKPVLKFDWHISDEVLMEMSEEERARHLNEKTTRLYDALNTWIAGEGKFSLEDLDRILNPEKYPPGEDRSEL